MQIQQVPPVSKPLRANSARPTNSRIGINISKDNPISNVYKEITREKEKDIVPYNAPYNNMKNMIERPASGLIKNNYQGVLNLNPSHNNMLNNPSKITLANPANLVTNNYNNININFNNNYYSNKPQFEYKSPYRINAPNPMSRPSSCRERSQPLAQVNQVNQVNNNNNNFLMNNNVNKKLIKDIDHKILINPIKIIDTPNRRIIPNNGVVNAIPNNYLGYNNPTRINSNNFLKGGRPVQNSPYEGNLGGIVKIIHNSESRPVQFRK